jgi:hypothetical protein
MAAVMENGRWGFVGPGGELVIKPVYTEVWGFE